MESHGQILYPLLLAGFALVFRVHAQDQTGFISIDCGLPAGFYGYTDDTTAIDYISDATFIDTGETKSVPADRENYQRAYWTLRSFPKGKRNCYKINVKSASRYLVRASFYYGNYDGLNKLPEFELHLGPNFWDTIRLDGATSTFSELIHYIPAKRNYLHVCLVDNGTGVPIISKIELRLLPNETYQTEMGQSFQFYSRRDTGPSTDAFYRYPHDIFDRRWTGYNKSDWKQLYTSSPIDIFNDFEPPSIVMSTAATPILATDNLTFSWESDNESSEFYFYMHFAELEKLPANQSRELEIFMNGDPLYGPFEVDYLSTTTVYSNASMTGKTLYTVTVTAISDFPPILNAIEIYKVKVFPEAETDIGDVNAISKIQSTYKIEKNWQGDPCSSKEYSWEGLVCSTSYPPNESPRIISLNLSSSGLIGEINASISELTMLRTLDLSKNSLTGPIPNSLSTLQFLKVLKLENNTLTGSIPAGLAERTKNGSLLFSLDELSAVQIYPKSKRHKIDHHCSYSVNCWYCHPHTNSFSIPMEQQNEKTTRDPKEFIGV